MMHELLLATARSKPNRLAVLDSDADGGFHPLTYRQLDRRVRHYAAALAGIGIGIGDRILLESDNSGSAVAMLLACSRLGATFIPISPDIPTPRLHAIASSVRPVLHLQTLSGEREDVPGSIGRARFGPDGMVVEQSPALRPRFRREPTSSDPAYIIFTSGTTGRPKGVVMSHRAVLAFYKGMLDARLIMPADRVATTSPLQFDFSLLDIGLALGSGATLVPVPRNVLRWPRRLLHFLAEAEVTQVNGVPSIWRSILRHQTEELAGLSDRIRGILYAGEAFPVPELRQLQVLLPHTRIVNCFGWTESVAASFTEVPNPAPAALSVGFAHAGAELMLVNGTGLAIAEPGVVGEIYLRGPSLFTGYWDDDEATAAALVPDPLEPRSGERLYRSGDLAYRGEHGELYLVGRADLQVQIHGYRVELGEIECRLLEYPGVVAATVTVERHDGDPELTAFLVLAPDTEEPDPAAVSQFCRQTLPDYMAPHRVLILDELPVTANGKTDRTALSTHQQRSTQNV